MSHFILQKVIWFYTVSELEVTNYKRLEMIEILNNCCISCLYLQEYKKGFAFLTKCHYFESRGGLNWAFENFKKFQKKFFTFFVLKCLFGSFRRILKDNFFFKKFQFFSMQRVPPLDQKIIFRILKFFFQIFFYKSLFWVNISYF